MSSTTAPLIEWKVDEEGALRAYVDGDRAGWRPQPGSQSLFLKSCVFETLYEGTRGPGKTDALLMSFAMHTGLERVTSQGQRIGGWGPEWRGILFRKTFKQLKDVIKKSRKWFPVLFPGISYNVSDHTWTWPTGEQLIFSYMENEKDYDNYHGHEYPWIAWEELTRWATPDAYLLMMSCCRSPQIGMPRMYRATTNPHGPGHNWVRDRFDLPVPLGRSLMRYIPDETPGRKEEERNHRCAIHGSIHENKVLLNADPSYIAKIIEAANGDEAKIQAWVHGNWDVVSGGMFDDVWNDQVHMLPAFAIPRSWKMYRSFDWGSYKPFSVGWWAVSDGSDMTLANGRVRSTVKGDLFRIAEWYGWTGKPNEGKKMLARDIAQGIADRETNMGIYGMVNAGPADSAIWSAENGVCIATDMMRLLRDQKQIAFVPADKRPGSRKTGWEAMRARYKQALPTDQGPRERPGIFAFESCDQYRRTIRSLSRDEKDPDDVDTNIEDHIADEARYMVRFVDSAGSSGLTSGGAA